MWVQDLYFNIFFSIILISFLSIQPSLRPCQVIEVPQRMWCVVLGVIAVILIASYPVDLINGGDRTVYATSIEKASYSTAHFDYQGRETLFHAYEFYSGKIMNYKVWFFVTASMYVGNYYHAACRLSKDYTYVLFLMMLCCFQFYGYGMNTIRAGLAGSFVILGITFMNKPSIMVLLLLMSYLTHGSMIVPISAIICALCFRKTKIYLVAWFAVIIISYFYGSGIEKMFQGLTDDQRTGYLAVDAAHTRYKVGFRWDFLLYSSLPVIAGYFYIYKLKFASAFYQFVYHMYLAANSFWILVIRANYTDRFAYLSWFLFPILLFYPLITRQLYRDVKEQRKKIFLVMFLEYGFTYFMYWKYK